MKSIEDKLREFVEYIDKAIETEYDKFPLSPEDAIRKTLTVWHCREIKMQF